MPFESLRDAQAAGYDRALDCLQRAIKIKDISGRLARKVLHVVNRVELAEDLSRGAQDRLGIDLETAQKILEARDQLGRFAKLEDLQAIEGVGTDKLMELVNAFK